MKAGSADSSAVAFDTPSRQSGFIMSDKNQLYFGDNLDVLGRYVADESVDLVYLDPPFNSNASYSVLFKEQDGAEALWHRTKLNAACLRAGPHADRSSPSTPAGNPFPATRRRWCCEDGRDACYAETI